MNIGFSINRRSAAIILLTALAIIALAGTWLSNRVSPAFAGEPPVDAGCFNGALSDDPLQCYVLEAAEREGIIKIESIFQGGKVLYVYLHDAEPVSNEILISDEVIKYFKAKSIEFVEQWPDHVFYGEYETCSRRLHTSPLDCLLNRGTAWLEEFIMPHSETYENILLRPWTSESLRSTPGWASYRQVWPTMAAGGLGVPDVPSVFDISEVDTTNIPEMDCEAPIISAHFSGCIDNKLYPNVGNIVGWYRSHQRGRDDSFQNYVHLKPPQGEELDIAAAKAGLVKAFPGSLNHHWTVIPVKYDYQELWRWANLIDRFAYTSGNTIGIISSSVTHNVHRWPPTTELVFVLPSLPEADTRNREDHRATIVVGTLHLQETVAALPKLLDQLGIPADAVGMVGRDDHTPERPRTLWGQRAEPDRAATGEPDIPPSGSNEDSIIPSPPDTGAAEADSSREPGQSHTRAGTAEEAPHTLAGTPPESEAKASDTPPSVRSGWTRRYQRSGEHIEPPTNSANGASAEQPTHSGPTDRKRSQSNTAINTVEDKSHTKKLPAAQTTPQ